ncbi:HAD family hydrolase [Labedella endophytica]|uniref:HAD family phosphatase n=1 Tax=Labedella endophytica TaxID=1523160 RepID=A0A3S1CP56_9MICO|nr:HAD family phosphatase [Labedella endophytica]RUQ97094.1 HAD family phosphatase [Labedella endophytica]
MTSLMPDAVLWDMDGTLVDTEPYWISAETDLVESFGRTWTYEDAMELVGAGLWDSAETLRTHGVDMPADEIVSHLTETVMARITAQGVPFRPGALELLTELRSAGVRVALVTMSIRSMAEHVVDRMDDNPFEVLVTGDEVARPKPHPDPYVEAASRLGVDVRQCVAIEDSRTGLASAVAAGTAAIAVPHAVSIPEGPEHTVWTTLSGRTAADVAEVFATRRRAEDAR